MFQKFDETASGKSSAERVARLRGLFDECGIDGFLVPRSDAFQGEYIPDCDARLAWLTGFTGSAGSALILRASAHLFVDGRYTIQAAGQVDETLFSIEDVVKNPPPAWIRSNVPKALRIGLDPWLHTIGEVRRLEEATTAAGATIVRLETNPVDAIWSDRPAPPSGAVFIQPVDYAGRTVDDKLEELQTAIADAGAKACVLTDPSSVAWCFNIRGSDVAHTPHPLAFAIVEPDARSRIFIDERKLDRTVKAYLTQLADIRQPDEFEAALIELAAAETAILVDPALAASRIADLIVDNGGRLVEAEDPARLPRAIKNETEMQGSRNAHRRDGAAMVSFLAWLDRQAPGSIDEISAVQALERSRTDTGERLQMPLREISFDTISGSGPNGAIVHYRVTTSTNRKLEKGELYLVDSGGQYIDGTTDITRTVPIGPVGEVESRWFTLVLKGMIAISMLRFPVGTRGMDIDAIARAALWKAGGDYAHGTGHGVGSFLSVHEGPQNISRRGTQTLEPGMVISNEPGYYREGAFGIRIENLVLVREAAPVEGGDTPMLGFETLTLCPIDRRLVQADLLDADELAWLNAYHARVREDIAPLLADEDDRIWLEQATAPL